MTVPPDDHVRSPSPLPPPVSSVGPDFALPPGSMLAGKYLVERVIAKGGFGVVLGASHVQLERKVAIKYLQPRYAGDQSFVDRFTREARLTAKIRSQHVVRVHDVAVDDRIGPYMVMEYLEGEDFDQILLRGPLQPMVAIDCIVQACDALAEAHALGVVHRDLKPANLFLARLAAESSVVKIIDFGISKVSLKRGEGTDQQLTGGLDTFGSPVYMSPEQLRSCSTVDARADIWAMGVVLFELVTGRLPFDGIELPQLVTSILSAEPLSLAILCPEAPEQLDTVVRKCLEKDPDKRYPNVAALVQDLEGFVVGASVERIRHIKRVIREVASIPPPTPMPASLRIENIQLALMRAAQPSSPDLMSTGEPRVSRPRVAAVETLAEVGRASNAPSVPTLPAPPDHGTRWRVALVGLCVAVALGVVGLLVRGRSAPVESTRAAEPAPQTVAPSTGEPAATGAPPVLTEAHAAETPTAPPTGATAVAPAPIRPPPANASVRAMPDRAVSPASGTSSAAASTTHLASPAPSGKPGDDYSQFGERR
jgi:serine/threonine protein kinase